MIEHDPIADELLAAGWRRDVRDGWWRIEGTRPMPACDALRTVRLDAARAQAGDCQHLSLGVAPAVGTSVAGAVSVTCCACGWSRTATPGAP